MNEREFIKASNAISLTIPNWESMVKTLAFSEWLSSQTDFMQGLANSPHVDDAKHLIRKFMFETNYKNETIN